jgi:hypothetical protein
VGQIGLSDDCDFAMLVYFGCHGCSPDKDVTLAHATEVDNNNKPDVKAVGLLVNPANPSITEPALPQMQAAAPTLGLELTSCKPVRTAISSRYSGGSLSLALAGS